MSSRSASTPKKPQELAAAKRTSYVLMYDRRQSGNGWHFLTGSC